MAPAPCTRLENTGPLLVDVGDRPGTPLQSSGNFRADRGMQKGGVQRYGDLRVSLRGRCCTSPGFRRAAAVHAGEKRTKDSENETE